MWPDILDMARLKWQEEEQEQEEQEQQEEEQLFNF